MYIGIYGPSSFTILYDHWPGLVTAALVNSFVQAVYVYVGSFCGPKLLALGGNSGNVLYDVRVSAYPVVHRPRAEPPHWPV